jgi:ligand-binding sensor domain-containing protein/signal transduction histidine kinase
LLFLAILIGLPTTRYATSHAFPAASMLQNAAKPVTDLPDPLLGNRLPSPRDPQSPDASARPNLRFDCLTATDGLSFSLATSILQDQRGFMWFGTRYGLDKYDGQNFTVYLPASGKDVLLGNYIFNIYQDRTGDLWLSTYADVVRWDMKTGEFIHFKADPGDPHSLTPGRAYTTGEDSTGTVWVGTDGGLNRYNPSTGNFTRFHQDVAVTSIHPDRRKGIWLGTSNGLWYYSSGSLEQQDPVIYRNNPADPASVSSDVILAIHEDQQGALWVGTAGGGLDRLERATGKFTHFTHKPDDPYSLSDNQVYSIIEDNRGRLWIGTQDGLNLFDHSTGRFFQYHTYPDDPHSLRDDVIDEVYQDRGGVIWVTTLAGICKLNDTASSFTFHQEGSNPLKGTVPGQPEPEEKTQPSRPPALSDGLITSIYEDNNSILWVGTSQGGLNRVDRSTGQVTVYRHDPTDPTSIGLGEVLAIHQDQVGTLWIGTQGGLDRFNPRTGAFESEAALQGMPVGSIVEDRQNNLWLGALAGLMRRAPGDSTFNIVSLGVDPAASRRILSLFVDHTGALWISAQDDGLFRLDPPLKGESTPTIIHFPQDSNDPKSPGSSTLISLYEDRNGILWLGSVDNGLIRFNRDTQTFVHYLPDTGTAKYVSCVQEDAQGFLWMGTVLGLARFDPQSETFAYFDARDGLAIGEGTDCFQNKQGEMFFGSISGLVTFFPDQIRDNPNPPTVMITALTLNNQPFRTDLLPDEQIKLSYRENYLSFDFVALDYAAPAKNQYAFMMEGLDPDWIQAGTRRHADYPDLKPGTYSFRVKASNNSGVWNEQGAAVQITITPPFWKTWWFLALVGVALAGAVIGGVRLRLKDVEARSRKLEAQVASRTTDLVNSVAQLTALQNTAKAVASTLELKNLLNLIIQQAITLLQADGGFINLVDWDRRVDEVVAVAGIAPPLVGERISLEESLSGWVTLHNQAIFSNEIQKDDRVARSLRSWVAEEHIQSAAAAPMIFRDQVKGTLLVIGRKEGKERFVQADLDLLAAFANQAAIAIENARLYEKSKELAVLEERSRLARELHDAVTQTLFSASLVAEALPATWEKDHQAGRGLLQELRSLSRGALAEMRTLLLELRPAALLETSLADLLRQLGEAASGRTGIPVSIQVDGQGKLPRDVHIAFYRIAQEALNNVVKHARARQVTVRLSFGGEDQAATSQKGRQPEDVRAGQNVQLSIRDDGRGFDPAQIPHNRLGLGIMQERAQAAGASLVIESQPGHGTEVTVLWEQAGKEEAK